MISKVLLIGLLLVFIIVIMIVINNTNRLLKDLVLKSKVLTLSSYIFFIYALGAVIISFFFISSLQANSNLGIEYLGALLLVFILLAYNNMGIIWITNKGIIYKGELMDYKHITDVHLNKYKLSLLFYGQPKIFYLLSSKKNQELLLVLKKE